MVVESSRGGKPSNLIPHMPTTTTTLGVMGVKGWSDGVIKLICHFFKNYGPTNDGSLLALNRICIYVADKNKCH